MLGLGDAAFRLVDECALYARPLLLVTLLSLRGERANLEMIAAHLSPSEFGFASATIYVRLAPSDPVVFRAKSLPEVVTEFSFPPALDGPADQCDGHDGSQRDKYPRPCIHSFSSVSPRTQGLRRSVPQLKI